MTQQSLIMSWLPPPLCAADQRRLVMKRADTIQGLHCSKPRAACSRTLATAAIQGMDATNHDRHTPHVHLQQMLSKVRLTKPRAASHTSLAAWFSTWTAKSDVFLVLVRVNRGCSVWRSWPLMYVSACGDNGGQSRVCSTQIPLCEKTSDFFRPTDAAAAGATVVESVLHSKNSSRGKIRWF
jgi:hypothetical protein